MSDLLKNDIVKIIDQADKLILASNMSSISHVVETNFIAEGSDLLVFLEKESITVFQTSFNPYVYVLINSDGAGSISYNGLIRPVEDAFIINKVKEKLHKGNNRSLNSDTANMSLFKIIPLKISLCRSEEKNTTEILSFRKNQPSLMQAFLSSLSSKIRLWLGIVRAPFFTASAASVILGAAIAFQQNHGIDWKLFFLTLIGAVFAHAAANVINDYYDHRSGNDEANPFYNAFSGGSRMIQNKLLTSGKTFLIAVCLFLGTIMIGLYLNSVVAGNMILFIGLLGTLLAFTYSASPLKLSYRGIGELAIVISYGPLIVLGTYYVQIQKLDIVPLLASIPAGILVGLILFINEFQDFHADGAVDKNTIVVKLKEKRRSLDLYKGSLIFAYCWLVFFTILNVFPIWSLLVLITFPMVLRAFKIADKNYDKIMELLPVNAMTIGLHLIFTLLFAAAFIIDVFI